MIVAQGTEEDDAYRGVQVVLLASEPVLGTAAARQEPGAQSTEQHNTNCHWLHIHRRCQSLRSIYRHLPRG
jgi:hypothetical protein